MIEDVKNDRIIDRVDLDFWIWRSKYSANSWIIIYRFTSSEIFVRMEAIFVNVYMYIEYSNCQYTILLDNLYIKFTVNV